MAGGIFTNQPFYANPKCIVISFIFMAIYWFWRSTARYWIMLPVIFVVTYVLIAWYDYVYDCSQKMFSGTMTPMAVIDSIFKPQRLDSNDKPNKGELLDEQGQKGILKRNVYLFHILVVAPLLIYIAWRGVKTSPGTYQALGAVGVSALFYHGFQLLYSRITPTADRS